MWGGCSKRSSMRKVHERYGGRFFADSVLAAGENADGGLSEEFEKARIWKAAQERKEREQGERGSPENPDRVVDSKIGETGDALRGVAGGVEEEEEGVE